MNNSQQGSTTLNGSALSNEGTQPKSGSSIDASNSSASSAPWTVTLPAGRKRPTRDERYGPHVNSPHMSYGATGLHLLNELRCEFADIGNTDVRVSGIMKALEDVQSIAGKNDMDEIGDEILDETTAHEVMTKIDRNKHDRLNQHVFPFVRMRYRAFLNNNVEPVAASQYHVKSAPVPIKTLGQTIKEEVLDRFNLTQSALADSIGMSRGTLLYYMTYGGGPSEKSRPYLEQIEAKFNINSGVLTKYINNPLLTPRPKPTTALGKALEEQFKKHKMSYGHFAQHGFTHSVITNTINKGTNFNRNSRKKLRILDKAFGLEDGYLASLVVDPYKSKRLKITHLVRKGTSEFRMSEIRGHLPDDFDEYPEEEQKRIIKFVEEDLIYTFDDEHPNSGRKGFYGLSKEDKPSVKGKKASLKAPDNILRVIERICEFKTKPDAAEEENREKTWIKEIARTNESRFLRFFGALVKCGYPIEKLTFELIFTNWAIETYIAFMTKRMGFETRTIGETLELLASMVNPELGYIAQYPGIDQPLTVIEGFVTSQEVEKLHGIPAGLSKEEQNRKFKEKWHDACKNRFKYISKIAKRIKKEAGQSRPVFEPIEKLLKNEAPLEVYYCGIMKELRTWTPNKRNYSGWSEHQRNIMLFRLAVFTGLRRRNLAELLIDPQIYDPNAKRHSNEWLRRKQRGEIRRQDLLDKNGKPIFDLKTGQKRSTYTLEIPKSAFKNRSTETALKDHNSIELPNLDGFYDQLETYLYEARKAIIGDDRRDTGEFFVSTMKRVKDKIALTPGALSDCYKRIIQVFGVKNKWTGRGAIPGMKAHRIHTIRHILATNSIKLNNGAVSHAAAILFDSEEMVKKAYSAYLPADAHSYAVNQSFTFLGTQEAA
ncbi:hypothetical protein [Cohaesibacter marisflavi]|uniref:hypothetical protein n=1 Tax=Cohaesibacter marisflavi TaxID=655353 RepID=UPI0029C70DE1|nr:hypothetical protein [Cohaesibacter marisflavi]